MSSNNKRVGQVQSVACLFLVSTTGEQAPVMLLAGQAVVVNVAVMSIDGSPWRT